MNNPIRVSIVNESTLFKDADLHALCNALQVQVTRDFYPAWGVNASIYYTPSGKRPTADHWIIAILDDADQAGALGYHDTTSTGLPLGKIFVRTILGDRASVSVTVSHELLEMLADPQVNLAAQDGNRFYSFEVGDPVEADSMGYEITIPAGWVGAGTKVLVSDFVFPSWFQSFITSGKFDFMGHVKKPLELSAGGYIGFLDLSNLNQGWQQITASTSPMVRTAARAYAGSRRLRRAMPKDQWMMSTYTPGTEAIVTGVK